MSSEWSICTIEQIAAPMQSALATGPFGSSISAKYFVESGVPVIRGSNLSPDTSIRLIEDGLVFVSAAKAEEFQRSIARQGDLIFTCWGTINQVGFIDRRASFDRYIVSNKQMKLTVDSNKADPRFIYYSFSGPAKQKEILDNGIGSSVPGFNLGQLKKHEILLPCLAEQVAIANLLEYLDDRIVLLRETNATLEAMAQALFKSWFVDFDPVHANAGTRTATLPAELQALFPSTFTDTPQGQVPEGWRVGVVGDVAQQKKGSINPMQAPERLFEHYSLPAFDSNQVPVLEKGEQIKSNKTPLPPNAVLLSKLNPHIPRVWLPFGYADSAVCSTEFLVYSPINGASKEFIYALFTSVNFLMNLQQLVTGTSNSHQRVKPDHIIGLELVIPSQGILAEFENAVKPLFERIGHNRQQAQTLVTLRDTLLPRLISGQLRLPDAEAALAEVGV